MGNISEYVTPNDPVKSRRLKKFRIAAVLIFIGIYIHSYFGMNGEYLYYVISFTQWRLFITGITFVLLLISSMESEKNTPGSVIHKLAFFFFGLSWVLQQSFGLSLL